MRLELIAPASGEIQAKVFKFPQLALPVLASLTPEAVEIHITDENIEPINLAQDIDLAGITIMTATAPRAYQIADKFRQRGTKVVMGGIHPTALPEEASLHADSVVIGEAEGIWPQVIEDFKKNQLKKFYKASSRPTLFNLPLPRRDLLNRKKYIVNKLIQTSRGCPYDCSFCSVTNFFGHTYRLRPIQDILQEIRILKAKFVGFLDDNIVGNTSYAKELFKKLIPERVYWVGQASLNCLKDSQLLKLLQKSGCKGLFVGLESISQENLKEIGKKGDFNVVSQFQNSIKRFHDHGISILGSFIFGFDHDDKDIFDRTVEFAQKIKLDLAQFGVLTPFPGTRLWQKLKAEGRILTRDWSKYDIGHVVFKPRNFSPEKLREGKLRAYRQFYSGKSIFKRIISLGRRFFLHAIPLLIVNLGYRKETALWGGERNPLNLWDL